VGRKGGSWCLSRSFSAIRRSIAIHSRTARFSPVVLSALNSARSRPVQTPLCWSSRLALFRALRSALPHLHDGDVPPVERALRHHRRDDSRVDHLLFYRVFHHHRSTRAPPRFPRWNVEMPRRLLEGHVPHPRHLVEPWGRGGRCFGLLRGRVSPK